MTTRNSEFYIASVYHPPPPHPIYNANELMNLCSILVIVPCRVIQMLSSLLLAMQINWTKLIFIETNALQERINSLIRKNIINVVNCEDERHVKGSKSWWDTVKKITSRNPQSALPISMLISPKEINAYFQRINTHN